MNVRSLYFSLTAIILECLEYLCTALRTGSAMPFAANVKSFGIVKPNFDTIVSKYSINISAIFWSSKITILFSAGVIVAK